MSDVEQQRSRSAVDLRKSSTKCRSIKTTQLNSTSSDNVLPEVFQIVRAENPRLPVDCNYAIGKNSRNFREKFQLSFNQKNLAT